jgi:hypothetical protein
MFKKASKFKSFDMAKQVDLLLNSHDIDVFYNNLKVDMLPKQSTSETWCRP